MKKSFLLLLIASISHAYIDCFNLDQLDEEAYILNMSLTERENCSTKAEVTATFTTSIDKKPNYSNEDLQKHEMKHYNTYMKYNEKVFEE